MVSLDVRRKLIERIEQGLGGGRKYSAEQMAKIDQHIELLNDYQFSRICEDFLNRRKSMPTPGDFEDAARPYLRQLQAAISRHQEASAGPNCAHCQLTGYVIHRKATQEAGMNIYARCMCPAGERPGVAMEVPQVTRPVECIPVEPAAFIPRKPGESMLEGVWRKAEAWMAKIEISKQYWQNQRRDG